jgi:hypothetical protein
MRVLPKGLARAAALTVGAASAACLAAAPATVSSKTIRLTDERLHPTPVATYGGVVAWWGNHRGLDRRLTVWRPGHGAPRRLPVTSTRSDLDLGPGPDGAVWATYVRCTRGRGCRPVAYDLRTGTERDLGVGRGRHPSIWRGRVALFRPPRGGVARLVVARLDARAAPHRVLVEGVEGSRRGDVAAALDLRGHHIAYIMVGGGGESRATVLRAGRVGSGDDVTTVDSGFEGEECTSALWTPTLTRFGVTWLREHAGDPSACGAPVSYLRRRLWRRGPDIRQRARLGAQSPVAAVVAGGRAVVLAPPPGQADSVLRDACVLEETLHLRARYGCRLTAGARPRWRHASR